jgi:hypothetical protein
MVMITQSELKDEILSLASHADRRFLILAKRLRMLHDMDRSLFREVIEQARLGSRKAYYLMELADRFRGTRLPAKRLEAIGWTKAQVIAKHLTRHNALSLIELAEQHNTRDLTLIMQGRSSSAPAPSPARCVLMYFSPHQYRAFEKAILQHGAVRRGRGLANKEKALLRLIGKGAADLGKMNVASSNRKNLVGKF